MAMSDHEKYWYWLASIRNIGVMRFFSVVQSGVPLDELFKHPEKIDCEKCHISPAIKKDLVSKANMDFIDSEIYELEKKGIRIVTMLSKEYPPALKEIFRPPLFLYVKGSLFKGMDRVLALVGTRRASRKGIVQIKNRARELAANGVVIVSGMARGIDSAAHRGALSANGVTVAVLGGGVDIVYPPENVELYDEIAEKGAVVSEYPPGSAPIANNFPVRNRIISGMARGVIVGEGAINSGAQNTVYHAYEENKDVFAVPAEDESQTTELPESLIDGGALIGKDARTILMHYGWIRENQQPEEEIPITGLDFFEKELYNLLLKSDMSVQQLVDGTNHKTNEINMTLTKLELKGLIERLPGNIFGKKTE